MTLMAMPPGEPPTEEPPPAAHYDTLKMEWEELRAERANQYSRNASISVVATALLGFEGVLVTRLPDLDVHVGLRTAAMIALSVSIVLLLDCLLDMPGRGPKEWRKRSKRALAANDPSSMREDVEALPPAEAVVRLLQRSGKMIEENHNLLLKRRRHMLHAAVGLFGVAFVLLGVGAILTAVGGTSAISDLVGSWPIFTITYSPPFTVRWSLSGGG
ncbi:hypothetical protein [Streptomyces spororaveus]|nr:hypothetical protein [Streptomyces spororaveus]